MREISFAHPLYRSEKIGTTVTDRLKLSIRNLRVENSRLRGEVGRGRVKNAYLQERVKETQERGVELWKVLYHYTLHSRTIRRLLAEAESSV